MATKKCLFLIAPICLFAEMASARFIHDDALEVDRDEQQGVESINDKLSYRYPAAWHEIYESSGAAFRVSAGSLSANRFDYLEDFKFRSERSTSDYAVGYELWRSEDYFEHTRQQQISFDGKVFGPLWFGILGDSGSYKEYGDLGVRLTWWDSDRQFVELKYWSVDHYYGTKKSEEIDNRPKDTNTIELVAKWTILNDYSFDLSLSHDQPLEWHRQSVGYFYEYEQSLYQASLRWQQSETDSLTLLAKHSDKNEAKRGLESFEGQHKAMNRIHDECELRWQRKIDGSTFDTGLVNIDRRARYDQVGPDSPEKPNLEAQSPSEVSRQEQAVYFRHNWPKQGIGDYFQWGLFFNNVRLLRNTDEHEFEVKLQTAWDFRHGKNGHAFFNITWDLDRVVENYPYRDAAHPFNPWGGGHVQFMVAF